MSRFFALVLAAAMAACCFGQAYHPATLGVSIGDWTLKPIYVDVGGTPSVVSILALANPGTTAGSNLVGVIYNRSPGAAAWSAAAWATDDAPSIVRYLKAQFGISDDDDALWGLEPDVSVAVGTSAVDPQEYLNGLLTLDPLYPLLANVDSPDELVAALKLVGYRAADPVFEKTDFGCLSGAYLDQVAAVAEVAITTNMTSDAAFASLTAGGACSGPTSDTPVSAVIVPNPTIWTPPIYTPGGVSGCWGFPSTNGNSNYTRCSTETRSRTCGSWGPGGTYVHCSQTRTIVHCKIVFCIVPCPGTPQPATPPCSPPFTSFIPEWLTAGTADTGWVGVSPAGCSC